MILLMDKWSCHTGAFQQNEHLGSGFYISFVGAGVTGLVNPLDCAGTFRSIKAEWCGAARSGLLPGQQAEHGAVARAKKIKKLVEIATHYSSQYSQDYVFQQYGWATAYGGGTHMLSQRLRHFLTEVKADVPNMLGKHITPELRKSWEDLATLRATELAGSAYRDEFEHFKQPSAEAQVENAQPAPMDVAGAFDDEQGLEVEDDSDGENGVPYFGDEGGDLVFVDDEDFEPDSQRFIPPPPNKAVGAK